MAEPFLILTKNWVSLWQTAKRSHIVQNAVSLYLIQFANYIVPLIIMMPYLVRVLEPAGYGAVAFAQGFINYLMLFVEYGFDWSATRRRVARGIGKSETEAAIQVFQTLKRRDHPDAPPPTISDGCGGIWEAMVEVYGKVPEYAGIGRPPTKKRPEERWSYLQVVKQWEKGRVVGIHLRVVYGDKDASSRCRLGRHRLQPDSPAQDLAP